MQFSTIRNRNMSSSLIAIGTALLCATLPMTAQAQDTAAPGASASVPGREETVPDVGGADTGDIIVTARKRAEDIQTVPISITAYTSQDLQERNISNFNDLANITPGISVTSISGGNVQNIYLRGIAPANTANDLNVEANVGVFIDGIYQTSRNTLDIISVLDVGQIEIAKGPQSALYGRSTFAGALGISTRRPSHQWEGSVSGTVGEDEDYRARGTISGPLTSNLYFRLAGGYLTYDGYGRNAADRKDNLGGTRKYAGNASLEWQPSPDFTARLSAIYTNSRSEITPETLLPLSSFNCGATNATTRLGLLYCGTLKAQKTSSITPDAPDTRAENRQISLDLNWRHDGVSVTSITGFTRSENRAFNDYDGGSAGLLFGACTVGYPTNAECGRTNFGTAPYTRLVRTNLLSTSAERVRTFSQEVRVQSDNESPFQWLVGGSFFNSRIPLTAGGIGTDASGILAANERLVQVNQLATPTATGVGAYDFTANLFLVPSSLTNQLFASYSDTATKTFGIFGSAGYKFGDFRVNAEVRYNTDEKRAQVFSVNNPASASFVNQPISGTSIPAAGTFPLAGARFKKSFNSVTPRFTVDYQARPDIFLYASAAKGVRSGGFNTANAVSATGILAGEVAYDEETNWTYEAGFKSKLFDRRLLLNASYFHVDWKNAQVSAFTNNPTAISPARIVQNAGNIKADGFEAQAEFQLHRMFAVGGNAIYSDTKFQKGAYDGSQITQCRLGTTPATYTAAPGCPPIIAVPTANGGMQYVPSLQGLRPQRSIKWQWNGHATVNAPINETLRFAGRVDVTYTGPSYNNLINTTKFGKRTLTSARIGIDTDNFSVAIFGNNLFDKTYVVNSINQPRAANPAGYSVPEIYLGEGRRIGVTGTAKF